MDPRIKAGIFKGESGGDYSALFGYQNREGGKWAGFDPRKMTINQVLAFQDPSGPYGQWVATQNKGTVSTPVGAYQIVGRTLRDFRDRMGLTGNELFDEAMQDRIGAEILKAQGTGAWEGYVGPTKTTMKGAAMPSQEQYTPNWRDQMILNIEGLMHRPNKAVMANAQARMDQGRADFTRNKTAEWFAAQGDAATADAISRGVISAGDAFRMKTTADASPNVQSSQMLPDMSGAVMTMRDGSVQVRTAGGDVVTGQEAQEFIRNANASYADQQRGIYQARREGTNVGEAETGAAAAAASELGKIGAQTANDMRKQAGLIRSNLTNLDDAIAAIDGGAKSGIVYNMLPNVTQASAQLQNAMDRMGLDVIGSVTFGALSEAELRLAMETAVPRNLKEDELRAWLVSKRDAQRKAYAGLLEAAQHFAAGGSMEDYIADLQDAAGTPPGSRGGTAGGSGGAVKTYTWTPDGGLQGAGQ